MTALRRFFAVLTLLAGCSPAAPPEPASPPPASPATERPAATGAAPASTAPGGFKPAGKAEAPTVAVTPARLAEGRLVLAGEITYETGSATLTPAADEPLMQVKQFLDDKRDITTLRVEVHTDSGGGGGRNLELSGQRALAVVKWLIAHGVAQDRLIAVGFGADKPIAPNDTPENKAMNRRTEFRPAALRGRAIGGMPLDGGGKVFGP